MVTANSSPADQSPRIVGSGAGKRSGPVNVPGSSSLHPRQATVSPASHRGGASGLPGGTSPSAITPGSYGYSPSPRRPLGDRSSSGVSTPSQSGSAASEGREASSGGLRQAGGSSTLPENAPTARHEGFGTGGGGVKQFYLAVDRQQYKMSTLLDLVEVLAQNGGLPLAVACSSRDVLDAIASAMLTQRQVAVTMLHSDQSEGQRAAVIDDFRAAVVDWEAARKESSGDFGAGGCKRASLLLTTDACVPSSHLGEVPLGAPLLINFELPTKKEAYFRRSLACIGPASSAQRASNHTGGTVINFVVAGEVETLRHLEESAGILIEEMPIQMSELL